MSAAGHTVSDVPGPGEYGAWFAPYVAAMGAYDPPALLGAQVGALRAVCASLSESAALHRYAPGKWSVKETLGHLSDAERMISHWLLRIGRGDPMPLKGFDEGAYVIAAGFHDRSKERLVQEFERVREATLQLVAGVSEDGWRSRGELEGAPITARALKYILTGHVEHHLEILRTRYGVAVPAMEQRYGPSVAA